MKKKIISVLLCSVFLLVSCANQQEPTAVDYEKISSELTELLNTTEPYSYYREWKNAEVVVTEDSFEILYPGYAYPFVKILEDDGKSMIQMYSQRTEKLFYTKGTESKYAYLTIESYVHMEQYNQILECTLQANDGQDVYHFFYDNELNTIFEYTDSIKEELVFTKSLQNSILSYCEDYVYSMHNKLKQSKQIVEWLLKEIGYETFEWQEDLPAAKLEYTLMDHSDEYEVMFEDFEPDEIYPLYHWNGQEMAENLFVVKKDGLYGVVNKEQQLVVPFISTNLPSAEEYHVHYTPAEEYRDTSWYYLPYSHYQICQGDHGTSGYYYYRVEGTDHVIKASYGHEGPYGLVEFEKNELNGQLNAYELIEVSEAIGDTVWIEETRYLKTGKYGVFSENGIVTDAIYDGALSINSDLAAMKRGEYWGYVDKNGDEVIPFEYEPILFGYPYPASGHYVIVKNQEGKFGILNSIGRQLTPFQYDFASPFIGNNAILYFKGQWKYIRPTAFGDVSNSFSLKPGTVEHGVYRNESIGLQLKLPENASVLTHHENFDSIILNHGEMCADLAFTDEGAMTIQFLKIDGSRNMSDKELYWTIFETYPQLFNDMVTWLDGSVMTIADMTFTHIDATTNPDSSISTDMYFKRHGDHVIFIGTEYDEEVTNQGTELLKAFEACYENEIETKEGNLVYFGNPETSNMFLPVPSASYVTISTIDKTISYGYEGGSNTIGYNGILTELDDHIYSASGNYSTGTNGIFEDMVKPGVDFYVVLKEGRMYAIFEDLSFEELRHYENDDYFKFGGTE
ncbi:MAG: WG repeat-containing protein [Erysipelotrichaceae bacterium]|nr:WG repeat-containing protein [Erysipelotrichaceae bacterium]